MTLLPKHENFKQNPRRLAGDATSNGADIRAVAAHLTIGVPGPSAQLAVIVRHVSRSTLAHGVSEERGHEAI